MAPRSKIVMLPADMRKWLDTMLADGNFAGYELIAAELKQRGFDISKSAVHRYGQELERKLSAIKASTHAAAAIAAAAPDDADLRSAAVISLIQTEVFDVLVQLQEAEAQDDPTNRVKLLGRVAKSIAELSRASVNQKKWQVSIEIKIREQERAKAAEDATTVAKDAGASPEMISKIRNALGVTV